MIQINIWPFLWTHFTSLLCSFSKLKKSKVKIVECKAIYTEVHTAAKQSGYRYTLFFRFDSQTEIIAAYTVIFYEIKNKIWWYFNCLATNLSSEFWNPSYQSVRYNWNTFLLFWKQKLNKTICFVFIGVSDLSHFKSEVTPLTVQSQSISMCKQRD